MSSIKLSTLMAETRSGIDPAKFADEKFELFSIPSYDNGTPEYLFGREIGSTKQQVQCGDVLISKIVPHIRRSWVVPETKGFRQIASSEWIVFRSPLIHPAYFRHYLMSDNFHRRFMTTVSGVGGSLLRAKPRQVGEFSIQLPSLPEQKRIAAILDNADEIQKKRGMAIQKLDLLAESIFVEMFGGSTNIKLQHLGDVVELQRGSSPRPISDWITSDPNGVNWIKIGDATASDKYITTCKEKIKPEGVKHSRLVREGDFLLSNSMSFGRPYILKTSGCIHDGWLLIRDVGERFHQDYLYALLSSSGVAAQFAKLASGAVVKNLNIDAVAMVQVLVPDLKDQKEFSRKVQFVESCKRKQLAALHSARTLQRSLMSVLYEK